ncbi:tyrosine-type recombinase/integrase [Planctomycetota bacterium]
MTEKTTIIKDPRKRKPWICRWFGLPDLQTGKQRRYSKAFQTRREAESFRAEQMQDFKDGEPRDGEKDVTFAVFTRDWLSTIKPDIRAGTLGLYRTATDRMLDYFGKNVLLKGISPRMAANFLSSQEKQKGDGDLSNWTRHGYARVGRTMFNKAIEWHLVAKNPFKGVGPSGKKLVVRDWHYVTPAEMQRLFRVSPLRRRAMYALCYFCGLRLSEALNTTWYENIILDGVRSRVKVKDRAVKGDIPPFLVKDYEAREVDMPRACVEILENLQAYNEMTDDTPFVCLDRSRFETLKARWKRCKASGKSWRSANTQNNALRDFKINTKRAGIVPNGVLAIHTLRKSAILNWARVNNNPEVTRVLAGHSTLATTMKYYSKIDDRQRRESVVGLDRLFQESDAKLTPEA